MPRERVKRHGDSRRAMQATVAKGAARFLARERRLVVRALVDRWFAPTQRWFRVNADDGNMYVLRQDEASGDWDIAAYRRMDG